MQGNFSNIPDYSGAVVYCIQNVNNDKQYIGSTMNFRHRIQEHISALKGGYHNSKALQNDFDKGDIFKVLELYRSSAISEKETKLDIRIKEYHFIIDNNTVDNGYNNVAFKVFAETHMTPPKLTKETIRQYLRYKGGKVREKEMKEIAEALNCELEIKFRDRETGKEF